MSERQAQHHGRSEGQDGDLPGRDTEGSETVGSDAIAASEDAREISELIDEDVGFDKHGNRYPSAAAARQDAERMVNKDRDHP